MSFQLTYKLIQQTPLIHFQHEQKGATLRASEVKPKLDKFIIEKMGWKVGLNNKNERKKIKETYKDWFIGDTDALNYKMRIVATGDPRRSNMIDAEIKLYRAKQQKADRNITRGLERERNAQINSMYFGNMVSGKGNEYEQNVRTSYRETVFYEGNSRIELEIICFVEGLKREIAKYIEEFFMVFNFGTRQSKGFGGFIAVKTDNHFSEIDPIQLLSHNKYRFFYITVPQNNDFATMLNHAKNIYAVMKGGYNHTKFDPSSQYIKGYIQRDFIDDYFSEDIGSDKAFIKSHMRTQGVDVRRNNYNDFVFSRALFGLADYYEFRDELRRGRVDIFSLDDENFDIERFRSPITIKIIGDKLIFLFGSFDKICNKSFYFSPNGIPKDAGFDKKNYSEKKAYIISNPSIFKKIETPEKFDDDDIIFFINAFANYFDKEKRKLASYRDRSISCSSALEIIVPPYLRRKI